MLSLPSSTTKALLKAKAALDAARASHDELQAALAENALNDLIERLPVTPVTRNRE